MEELPSLNWLIEQKFQIFDVANFDYKRAEGKPQKKSQQNFNKNGKVTRKRPRESLAVLIYQAMQFHKRKLTVAEISNYICNKYDYYRMRKHWTITGTIRNALSKDGRFYKIGRSQSENKRGCFWTLTCETLWSQILNGTAPLITSENEFRIELKKFNTYQNEGTLSETSQSTEPFYSSSIEDKYNNWADSDNNFDALEFEDFEMLVREAIDDKHPWQDDRHDYFSNEWNDWMF